MACLLSGAHINDLPSQILTNVFKILNVEQHKAASLVCKRWYEAANAPKLRAKMTVKISAEEDDWDALSSIAKRKIPNLTICFFDAEERISPEIVHHTDLASQIKYLCLYGCVHASSVIFSRRHFPNLTELSIVCHYVEPDFFFGSERGLPERLSASLEGLPSLEFEHMAEAKSANTFCCLSGPKKLFLRSFEPPDEYLTSSSPMNGDAVMRLLTTENLAHNLMELDLSHFYVSHERFRDIVNTPELKISSLTFTSVDGGGRNLEVLADSTMKLRYLRVYCEGQECFDVRYPLISSLILKKPSLNEVRCYGIKYPLSNGGHGQMTRILRDWPKLNKLDIPKMYSNRQDYPFLENGVECETALRFTMKNRFITLTVQPSSICDDEAIQMLVRHSPRLCILHLCQIIEVSDCMWMSIIAKSLRDLTELTIADCNLMDVELSVLGVSLYDKEDSGLPNLEIIRLRNCEGIVEEDLMKIHFPKLKFLWLTKCSLISDSIVRSVVAHNPNLQLLGLGETDLITNDSMEAIGQYLKHLRCLFLNKCPNITEDMASVLMDGCQMLEYIDVTECDPQLISALLRRRRGALFLRKVKGGRVSRPSWVPFEDEVTRLSGDREEWESLNTLIFRRDY